MMNRYEFIHDQYAGVNFEHNFGNGIFRLFPKLKFRQFWTAKALWGSLSDANRNSILNREIIFKPLMVKHILNWEPGSTISYMFSGLILYGGFYPRHCPKTNQAEVWLNKSFKSMLCKQVCRSWQR